MSRARHEKHRRAEGGRTEMKVSGNPDVFKEAEVRKKGGAVKKHTKMQGEKPKHRSDKMPRRASGGRVGADKSPLSSAHRSTKSEGAN